MMVIVLQLLAGLNVIPLTLINSSSTNLQFLEKDIAGDIQDMIVKVVSNDVEFDQVVLYIPSNKINDYDFFVQKGDQVVQLNVTEIY